MYVNQTIKAVFSSQKVLNKWLRVIYHPQYKQSLKKKDRHKIPQYDSYYLDQVVEDENYSIYLLQCKIEQEVHNFYSDEESARKAMGKFVEKHPHSTVAIFRVIIDYTYEPGLLETPTAIVEEYSKMF